MEEPEKSDLQIFVEFFDRYKGWMSYYVDERGKMSYIIVNNPVRPVNLVFCFDDGKFLCVDAERERGR